MTRSGDVPNPYVCRLLRRVDAFIWRVRLRTWRRVFWSRDGHLCRRYPKGHGGELGSHFPGWMFRLAARLQNRWPVTRKLLSW